LSGSKKLKRQGHDRAGFGGGLPNRVQQVHRFPCPKNIGQATFRFPDRERNREAVARWQVGGHVRLFFTNQGQRVDSEKKEELA